MSVFCRLHAERKKEHLLGALFLIKSISFLIIQHTVAKSLKIGVLYLLSELLAHTLCVIALFPDARAVSAPRLEPLFYRLYYLLIGIQLDCHIIPFLIRR